MLSEKFKNTVQQLKQNRDYDGLYKLIWKCDDYQKVHVTEALKEIGDEKAMETLAKIITRDPTEFGRIASTSLSKMDNVADVVKYAILAYENGIKKGVAKSSVVGVNLEESVKLVISSLGEKAVEPLLDILTTEGEIDLSNLINKLLPLCITDNSIELLKVKLFYPERWIREIVSDNLLYLKWVPSTIEEKVTVLISKYDWKELVKLGEPAVEYLIESMNIKDECFIKRKPKIIKVIGEIGSSKAVESLIETLNDNSYPKATIKALGNIGDPKAVTAILNHSKHTGFFSNLFNSSLYVDALTQIGEPAKKSLTMALDDSNKNVQKIARKALKNLKS